MQWIHNFQLFLFDFDGLLVNTEHLHYQAYINMLQEEGHSLGWGFRKFCEVAHLNSTALRETIYLEFPTLDPNWDRLYKRKKELYLELVQSGKMELMPGVEKLLSALQKAHIERVVVTNSFFEQTSLIRAQIPALQTIPHWITRESYALAKPNPECYLRAIALYGKKGDRIIGFEDSLRGIEALKQTPALPVLICSSDHPLLKMALGGSVVHFDSLEKIEKV